MSIKRIVFVILLSIAFTFAISPQEFQNKYIGKSQSEIIRDFGKPNKEVYGSWHYKIKVDDYGTVIFHFTQKNGVYVVSEISIFR